MDRTLTLDANNVTSRINGVADRIVEIASWTVERNELLVFQDGSVVRADLRDAGNLAIPGDSFLILSVRKPNELDASELRHIPYQKYLDVAFGLQPTLDYRETFEVVLGDGGRKFFPDWEIVLKVKSSVVVDVTKSRFEMKLIQQALAAA